MNITPKTKLKELLKNPYLENKLSELKIEGYITKDNVNHKDYYCSKAEVRFVGKELHIEEKSLIETVNTACLHCFGKRTAPGNVPLGRFIELLFDLKVCDDGLKEIESTEITYQTWDTLMEVKRKAETVLSQDLINELPTDNVLREYRLHCTEKLEELANIWREKEINADYINLKEEAAIINIDCVEMPAYYEKFEVKLQAFIQELRKEALEDESYSLLFSIYKTSFMQIKYSPFDDFKTKVRYVGSLQPTANDRHTVFYLPSIIAHAVIDVEADNEKQVYTPERKLTASELENFSVLFKPLAYDNAFKTLEEAAKAAMSV